MCARPNTPRAAAISFASAKSPPRKPEKSIIGSNLCLHAPACATPLFNMLLSVRQLLARIIISGKANAA